MSLYFRRTDRLTARHSEMQHKLSSLFARLRLRRDAFAVASMNPDKLFGVNLEGRLYTRKNVQLLGGAIESDKA